MEYTAQQGERLIRRIMRRVYLHWFARRVAPTVAAQLALAYFSLAALRELIFVKRVLETAQNTLLSSGAYGFFLFVLNTFARAGVVKNVLMIVLAVTVFIALRDLRRAYFVLKRQRGKGLLFGTERFVHKK